ncbi:hypothetical protein JCM17961_07110 [Endothiovibrio diazotrophicus]
MIVELLKPLVRGLLRLLFRVRIHGFEHYLRAPTPALVVANHTSFLDAVLLTLFLPDRPSFVVNTYVAEAWWLRPLLPVVDFFPMDPLNPLSVKSLIHHLKAGHRAVIFPEGRITVTGTLMKIYPGPAMVADRAGCPLIPLHIDGPQYSRFSRMQGRWRLRWFPRVTLTFLAPRTLAVDPALRGRARRRAATRQLARLMAENHFATAPWRRTLGEALVEARRTYGGGQEIAEDIQRQPLSYSGLLRKSLVLGRLFARETEADERVGLLLPNTVALLVSFFALSLRGRTPALLNFTAGPAALLDACTAATLKRVYTSRRFIATARLQPLAEALARKVELVYLEDLRERLSLTDKLYALLAPRLVPLPPAGRPDDPAVVLFTSGSEGTPKGVVLSHANLLANRYQVAAEFDFGPWDTVLNALPMFHSFGLTAGTLIPLLGGAKVFLYPSPLHYHTIPELAYDRNATALLGTDTFLRGYARRADPMDFRAVRVVIAGAEPLREETRRVWAERFGVRLLEGYGATETAPVLAANSPHANRPGSVGRLLPGIDHRIEPVEGITDGGRLIVRGPNVMLGYLKADRPGRLQPPAAGSEPGWYDTGDVATLDEEGFLTLRGRLKRFAKVAGEMVPLGAAEALAERTWPDHHHAVVALPDERKGERLILLTDCREATPAALLAQARHEGLNELLVPRRIHTVERLPLLGSGKTDYPAATRLARSL